MVQAAPQQLIENRTCYAGPHAELCIYDTYLPATRVNLRSSELLYCGMIHGRKIMHNQPPGQSQCDPRLFLPHQSYLLAPDTQVQIDFPEARLEDPTRCLTVEIARETVLKIAEPLQQDCPLPEHQWGTHAIAGQVFHTDHSQGTQSLLNRLFQLFTHNDPDRDVSIEFGIAELVSRLLRHQGRDFLLENSRRDPELNGIQASLAWLQGHLAEPLNIDKLSKIACMSRSRFFALFKKQLGCTPAELHLRLRLQKAATMLTQGASATRACFDAGFTSPSHFSRRFLQQYGRSPSQYRRAMCKQ